MTTEHRAREIAKAEYESMADGAEPFDEIWERTAARAAPLAGRSSACPGKPDMTDDELRRWWRATIRMANALAMQKRVQVLLERATVETKMVYLDIHESRGLDDQLPLTLDPISGRIVEGKPPVVDRGPPPVPRPALRPGRPLTPTKGEA